MAQFRHRPSFVAPSVPRKSYSGHTDDLFGIHRISWRHRKIEPSAFRLDLKRAVGHSGSGRMVARPG